MTEFHANSAGILEVPRPRCVSRLRWLQLQANGSAGSIPDFIRTRSSRESRLGRTTSTARLRRRSVRCRTCVGSSSSITSSRPSPMRWRSFRLELPYLHQRSRVDPRVIRSRQPGAHLPARERLTGSLLPRRSPIAPANCRPVLQRAEWNDSTELVNSRFCYLHVGGNDPSEPCHRRSAAQASTPVSNRLRLSTPVSSGGPRRSSVSARWNGFAQRVVDAVIDEIWANRAI